jgi:hypothetical protein
LVATNAENPAVAWAMNFFGNGTTGTDSKTNSSRRAWCVRGGMYADTY